MRSSSKLTMMAVVLPSSDTRSPRSRSSSSARRWISAGSRDSRFSSRGRTSRPPSSALRHPWLSCRLQPDRRKRLDDRGGRQAVHLLDRVDAFDVVRDLLDCPQRVAERRADRLNRPSSATMSDARSGELLPETLVVHVDRVRLREPGGDVVVDLRDVGARRERERAEHDDGRERDTASGRSGRRATWLI